jgi:hypothetical protein
VGPGTVVDGGGDVVEGTGAVVEGTGAVVVGTGAGADAGTAFIAAMACAVATLAAGDKAVANATADPARKAGVATNRTTRRNLRRVGGSVQGAGLV